ncbi:hypothetical protein DFH27DRAFT_485394, partial [Peziza echinospora]
ELHGLLGMLGYYRSFMPNFAKYTKPLNKLKTLATHKGHPRKGYISTAAYSGMIIATPLLRK